MLSFGQKLLHIVLVNLPTIVPEVFARLGPSNVAKPLSINMVNHLTWRNKFCLKQCPHSQKKDHQHAVNVRLDLPSFFCTEDHIFH